VVLITSLGGREAAFLVLGTILFGVDLRKGFVLVHVVTWTAFVTSWAKDFFALPRPFHIDAAVRAIGKDFAPTPFKGSGVQTFWGFPDKTAIEFARWYYGRGFGFPSGHTSGAVSLYGGLAVLFPRKPVILMCGLLMLLVPFSRLYLGRHFIADVLGGYALGAVFVLMVHAGVLNISAMKNFLFFAGQWSAEKTEKIFLALYLIGLPLLIMLMFPGHAVYPALLLGLNLGFYMVGVNGLPDDRGTIPRRIMRVCISALVFLMTRYLFEQARDLLPRPHPPATTILMLIAGMAVFFSAAVEINIRLGLMKRSPQQKTVTEGKE
jgi:membrane-associated phospholipid phosphatase